VHGKSSPLLRCTVNGVVCEGFHRFPVVDGACRGLRQLAQATLHNDPVIAQYWARIFANLQPYSENNYATISEDSSTLKQN